MTNDGSHQYTYDAENRVTKVDSGSTATYTYDPAGRRVRQTTAASDYEYIFDLQGKPVTQLLAGTNSTATSEWYVGGRHLATAQGSAYFSHVDWLGTERARTDMSGNVVETCTSLPFGDAPSCTGTDYSRMHFTGQEHDSESNLEHFAFRQYSNTQGRWMHPDPAGLAAVDPSNPQTWNRYAYVGNKPLSATDPSGLLVIASCLFDNTCDGGASDDCDVWNIFCFVYGDPWDGGGPSGPGGVGGFQGRGPRGGDHGPWPGNETTGLPQLPTQPLSLGDLLGLSPGCDFGVCDPVFGLEEGTILAGGPGWWQNFTNWLSNLYWSPWPKKDATQNFCSELHGLDGKPMTRTGQAAGTQFLQPQGRPGPMD